MTTIREPRTERRAETSQRWAVGGVIFAGTLLILNGALAIIQGISAVNKDNIFVAAPNYLLHWNAANWGWVHIVLGAVAVLAGLFVFTGSILARAVGITFAVFSLFANFFFLPYYPLWSLVIIALDVFVIWALATARRPDRI
jgi:uncharacterized membrane protein